MKDEFEYRALVPICLEILHIIGRSIMGFTKIIEVSKGDKNAQKLAYKCIELIEKKSGQISFCLWAITIYMTIGWRLINVFIRFLERELGV